MFILELKLFGYNFSDSTRRNGIYVCYSDSVSKLLEVKDLLALEMLREMSLSECSVYLFDKDNHKNEHCYYNTDITSPKWDLARKHDYVFMIDIFDCGQCGCEEEITLRDLENGILNEKCNKKYSIIRPPCFEYTIKEYDSDNKNIIWKPTMCYYNNNIIETTEMIKQIQDHNHDHIELSPCYQHEELHLFYSVSSSSE